MRLTNKVLIAFSLVTLTSVAAQAQGTVTCKDGAKSKSGQGACSRHGGIAPAGETKQEMKATKKEERKEMRAEAKKDARADAKMDAKVDEKKESKTERKREAKMASAMDEKKEMAAADEAKEAKGASAECKDHTYSHARTHKGACSTHGGVLKFLDGK
ncbi:MAG: DUF3761 domain-containing protein [bacterium]